MLVPSQHFTTKKLCQMKFYYQFLFWSLKWHLSSPIMYPAVSATGENISTFGTFWTPKTGRKWFSFSPFQAPILEGDSKTSCWEKHQVLKSRWVGYKASEKLATLSCAKLVLKDTTPSWQPVRSGIQQSLICSSLPSSRAWMEGHAAPLFRLWKTPIGDDWGQQMH